MDFQTFFLIIIFLCCLIVAAKIFLADNGRSSKECDEILKLTKTIRSEKYKMELVSDGLEVLNINSSRERNIERLLSLIERSRPDLRNCLPVAEIIEFPSPSDRDHQSR